MTSVCEDGQSMRMPQSVDSGWYNRTEGRGRRHIMDVNRVPLTTAPATVLRAELTVSVACK